MSFEEARAASLQGAAGQGSISFEVARVASLQLSEPHHHRMLPARRHSEPQYGLSSGGQFAGLLSLNMSFEAVLAASSQGVPMRFEVTRAVSLQGFCSSVIIPTINKTFPNKKQ